MSIGGNRVSPSYKVAVDAATKAGVTCVVSAGNRNKDACGQSPAYVKNAITVGATMKNDQRASFSNFGKCVDIWGPGAGIKSAGERSDTDIRILSGPSMS